MEDFNVLIMHVLFCLTLSVSNQKRTTINEPNPEGEEKTPVSVRVCRIEFHGQQIGIGRHQSSTSVAEQRASLEAIKVLQESLPSSESESPTPDSLWSKCRCMALITTAKAATSSSTKKKVSLPHLYILVLRYMVCH
jgi:hypothetical protein